jgi:hypothetical protein
MDNNYFPEVLQVIPTEDFRIYIYFDDGTIKLYDAKDIIDKGIFKILQDKKVFIGACTVLNGTLAWDLEGNYNTSKCLDLDPLELYNTCPDVDEPMELFGM